MATLLLTKLEDVARELGLKVLYTEASITAQPFFSKREFEVIKEQNKEYNGVSFVNYVMQKLL